MRVSPLAAELSQAERLPPRIACGSKPLKTTMEVSDRRESERFPIMRCNRLRPWLLCDTLSPRASGESSGGFTIRCQSQRKFTKLHHPVNSQSTSLLTTFIRRCSGSWHKACFSLLATTVNPMKINIIPTNKLAMLSAVACAVMLAFTNNARADAIWGLFDPNTLTGDTHVVGTVSPAAPASPQAHADYINFLITMATNTSVAHDFGGLGRHPEPLPHNQFVRFLPTASATGAVSASARL